MGDYGFWRLAEREPDTTALIMHDGRSMTRGELLARSNQLVHGLRTQGVEAGDSVVVVQPNDIPMVEVYLAAMQAGVRITPINHHLVGPEIAYIVDDTEAKVAVVHERFADPVDVARKESSLADDRWFAVGDIDGFRSWTELTEGQPTDAPQGRTAGQATHYTSGTTGRPKGVRRAMFEIDPNDMAEMMTGLQGMFGIVPEDGNVHICGSPLYHTAPLMWFGSALHMGHPAILMDRWDSERFMELVDEHAVTWSHMVPAQFHRILGSIPAENRGRYDVSSLRAMVHAAAPCPADVKRQMIDWWGDAIWEYYAATEGGGTSISAAEWTKKPGSVGLPWPGAEIRVLDDDHNDVPTGEEGTVYMSLALADFEYKGDRDKTESNRVDGFFTVGDWGLLDDDGYLFLKDRRSDLILSGGVNVYPAEIEAALLAIPTVGDAAVFGIPNEEWGQEIKAVVQPRELSVLGSDAARDELRSGIMEALAESLAKFKHPRSIDLTEQMPRDPSGKLFKRKLRDPYWEGHDG
ncbi:MAG: AMP-binding protein [Actinomycetia bacterium]|nr:AMP-binding protein [Actinomycetes bacterium]